MTEGPHHEIADLRREPGELSFETRIGGQARRIWLRADTDVVPGADAVLAACLMPAMRSGGTLRLPEPVSPRILRTQREFQAIQRAWSHAWQFGDPPLREVEVLAPTRVPEGPHAGGRVAAFFSGGVDSWSTVLDHPEITDLIFVRGFDLIPGASHHAKLADEVEARVRWAAEQVGIRLHVVDTNLREFSDPLVRWDTYYGCALVAVSFLFASLFERVLIAGDSDYEAQVPMGANLLVDQLWSSERLEIVDDGGRYSRVQRMERIAAHPVVQQTLRVCWENPGGAYNCGRCRKCLMTLLTLEALGAREAIATFPPQLDLEAVAAIEIQQPVLLALWEDVLDAVRLAGRADLERVVEAAVSTGKRRLGLPPGHRRRALPGPPPTVRTAVIVPVWRQSQYLASAVRSALDQEIESGVGVVIVNDGCPDPGSHRVALALRDTDPDRVAYLRQPNEGLSAARNAGIRRAFARWPHVEAVFPLDADNMLSPQTLAKLWELLTARPEASWASPALELFGTEEGEWRMPEPYLAYRQLFTNQSDAGSLIRRRVFEAGIEFDETMRDGFEDWEFFLQATLVGFRGAQAGRCGFRYRRRPESMLAQAQPQAERIEAEMRRRHRSAYSPGAQARREHAEAPRFALVRCDRDDVLLTAACDLPPHRLALSELLCPGRGDDGAPHEAHVPAITVLTSAAAIEWLEDERLLAGELMRLQVELRDQPVAGLRIGRDPGSLDRLRRRPKAVAAPAALALRTRMLTEPMLAGMLARPGVVLEVKSGRRRPPEPLSEPLYGSALDRLRASLKPGDPLIAAGSHAQFFEHRHLDLLETTMPSSESRDDADAYVERVA
jgi:hypothetical protein